MVMPRLVIDQEEWKKMKKTEVIDLEKQEKEIMEELETAHTKGLEEDTDSIRLESKRKKKANATQSKKRKLESKLTTTGSEPARRKMNTSPPDNQKRIGE